MRLLNCQNSENKSDSDDTTFAPALSLAQLVQYNSALQRKDIAKTRHKTDKGTPLIIKMRPNHCRCKQGKENNTNIESGQKLH